MTPAALLSVLFLCTAVTASLSVVCSLERRLLLSDGRAPVSSLWRSSIGSLHAGSTAGCSSSHAWRPSQRPHPLFATAAQTYSLRHQIRHLAVRTVHAVIDDHGALCLLHPDALAGAKQAADADGPVVCALSLPVLLQEVAQSVREATSVADFLVVALEFAGDTGEAMKQFVAARVVEAFGEKLLAREHLSTKGKWPSLEEVEVSGKRVVVLANRNLGNVAHEMEFKTFKQWTMGTCKENNQMLAVLAEDSTVLNVPFLADPVYNASSVYGVVDDWEWVRKCGVQMILGGIDEAKARKMLWSWDIDAGFPEIDTRKRCAIMALSNRDNSFRIQNARCFGKGSQQRFHLCRKVTDRSVWKRSRTETTYFEPQCPEGFIFSAPISYSEYMSLYESAIAPALKDGLKSAWINYSAPTAFNCWTTGASHISPCVKDFPLNKSLDVGVVANLTLVDVSISSTEIIKKILHAFPMASKQVRILNRENEKIQLLFHPENSVGKASVLENYAVFELGRMGLLNDLLISKNVLFSDSEIIALEKCLVSENSVWSITCNESEPPLDSVGQHGKWWTNLPLWIQILISFGIFTLLFSLISSTIILVKRRNNRGDKKVKGPLDSSLSSNESYSVNEPLQNSSNEALSGKGSSESSSRSFQDRNNQRKKLFSP